MRARWWDSHALVGSCAQIGKRVHLSAAAQIGGVLEPVSASPVIIEDDVLVGGNTGVYEGTIVRSKAVLAAGTVLTRGTPVYDVVRGEIYRATPDRPLIIPSGAVVVPGSRAVTSGKGQEWGLSPHDTHYRQVSGREDRALPRPGRPAEIDKSDQRGVRPRPVPSIRRVQTLRARSPLHPPSGGGPGGGRAA